MGLKLGIIFRETDQLVEFFLSRLGELEIDTQKIKLANLNFTHLLQQRGKRPPQYFLENRDSNIERDFESLVSYRVTEFRCTRSG